MANRLAAISAFLAAFAASVGAAPCSDTVLPLTPDIDCHLEQLLLASGDSKRVSVEANGLAADVAFRGLSTSVVCTAPQALHGPTPRAPSTTVGEQRANRESAADDQMLGGSDGARTDMVFTAYFELVNAYKGADEMEVDFRRVNVSLTPGPQGLSRCYSNSHGVLSSTPVEYLVFCKVDRRARGDGNGPQLRLTAVTPWDERADERLWMAFGWSSWSDWSACSVSCSTGIQQRLRHCRRRSCTGPNIQRRHCNLFSCSDAVSPLTHAHIDYFHPPVERWAQVAGRPSAFHLTPNSYIWLPSINLFDSTNQQPEGADQQQLRPGEYRMAGGSNGSTTAGVDDGAKGDGWDRTDGGRAVAFPREFVLFVTLRVQNNSYGTIFSLRSRRRQDTYLSLEAAGSDVKVIHAGRNGTDVIRVPAYLDDGNWHQVAVSVRDDSVIDSYVDCQWSRTDVLHRGSLDIPQDSDLIIGYLFEGDLEQLTIVPDPSVVNLQCTNDVTPVIDPSVQDLRSDNVQTPPSSAVTTLNDSTRTDDVVISDRNMESNTIELNDLRHV